MENETLNKFFDRDAYDFKNIQELYKYTTTKTCENQ